MTNIITVNSTSRHFCTLLSTSPPTRCNNNTNFTNQHISLRHIFTPQKPIKLCINTIYFHNLDDAYTNILIKLIYNTSIEACVIRGTRCWGQGRVLDAFVTPTLSRSRKISFNQNLYSTLKDESFFRILLHIKR